MDGERSASSSGTSLDFASLPVEHPRLAEERVVTARDGAALRVRTYGDEAPVDLVLVHGSGAFNFYFADLASAIADSGAAVVHTPDLRGHGAEPERRGDIDYIDQLEDDLADLIAELAAANPERKLVLGGHSSGGGLAIRFAGGPHAEVVDGYLLLAPFLQHAAPTTRPRSGGWATPRLGRIIALTMLNAVGIRALNGATVLEFDMPVERRSDRVTLAYSFRMMSGINPRDYESDLAAMRVPLLVIVGTDDEAFIAARYPEVFAAHVPDARVALVEGAGHLALVANAEATRLSIDWLLGFANGQPARPGRLSDDRGTAPVW